MNIEEGIIKAKAILDNHREIDKMMVIEMVELVETLLTAYEKEKEKNKELIDKIKKMLKELEDRENKQPVIGYWSKKAMLEKLLKEE